MADSFLIQGPNELRGDIFVQGSKNAATKLIAATLLTKEPCVLRNIPRIQDVYAMLDIISQMGGNVQLYGNQVKINNSDIRPERVPQEKVRQLRSSIVLAGPLLARFGKVTLPWPGGDKIGTRSLDTHLNAFRGLGYRVRKDKKTFTVYAPKSMPKVDSLTLDEFSVTATENMLMLLSSRVTPCKVAITAQEPHVQNLIQFLRKMGASISFSPKHTIKVSGRRKLKGASQTTTSDYIEAGSLVAAALAVGGDLRIHKFPFSQLDLFLHHLNLGGANISEEGNQTLRVQSSPRFHLKKVQTMIYPGIPTDLQSPLGTLATQSPGKTIIHDPLYEGRLSYLRELRKMGAQVKILDPHRAEVHGPTQLNGVEIQGRDIRGGMSLIIAGMAAHGQTLLRNVYQVDRGYEKIDDRLQAVGAKIERLPS